MKFYKYFLCLLLPHKFYKGGGGGQTAQINPEEQALAQISQEKWDEYKARYVPLENQWIDKVGHLNDASYHNDASALASNEVKAQYGEQTSGLAGSMTGQRVGGNDYLNQANNITQARSKANTAVTDRSLNGTQDIIAMGQGQATQGLQGMNDVANASVNAQIANNTNKFYANQNTQAMYGTVAGGLTAASANYSPNNSQPKTK
jgi:hypothetical protein